MLRGYFTHCEVIRGKYKCGPEPRAKILVPYLVPYFGQNRNIERQTKTLNIKVVGRPHRQTASDTAVAPVSHLKHTKKLNIQYFDIFAAL